MDFTSWGYWSDAGDGTQLNHVGYNHACNLLRRAVGDMLTPEINQNNRFRLYYNIPFHHDPKGLKATGLPLIVCTMFEATKLPDTWRDFLNKYADAVIVPTKWCRDFFRVSGVNKPIKIATLGVDQKEFSFIPTKPHDGYVFFWQGHNYDPHGRKAAGIVEMAFSELKNDGKIPDARLIMKYRPHEKSPIIIENLYIGDGITHIGDTIPRQEMHRIMSEVDCCINPSRGEGFGFIPLEQMAMGKPVLLTDWSFPFVDDRYNIPLKYDLKQSPVVWCHKHFAYGKWGYEYNLGKKFSPHNMPNLLPSQPYNCWSYGPNGKQWVKPTIGKFANNLLRKAQQSLGLYWKYTGKRHTVMFEHPGYDASVDIHDLKAKMLWCYSNREKAREIGCRASEWVKTNWGIDRIKQEFEQAIIELRLEGVI